MQEMTRLLLVIDERICYYEGHYYTSFEGQSDFFNRYLRVFDRLRVVCRKEDIRSLKNVNIKIDEEKIEIVPAPMFRGITQFIKSQLQIRRILKGVTNECDCGILRIPSALALAVYNQLRRNKIPYATEVVYDGKDGYSTAESILEYFSWRLIHRQMQQMCFHAQGVACVTQCYLQKHYYSKRKDCFTANYSTLAMQGAFYTQPKKYPKKQTFVISHIANQIIFKGRKGHKELIDAIAVLKERGLNVVVKFAGKDYDNGISLLNEYANKKGVIERVMFAGYLKRSELETYLEESDLYVMPTRAEGLPRVIIEAMAKGLPCLTTDVSGNSELIDKDMMFDYYNTEELSYKIEKLISNPVLYEKTSLTNFQRSLNYEASILQKRRDEFYNKLKCYSCS